jgi:predicted nucleotidyltransferase
MKRTILLTFFTFTVNCLFSQPFTEQTGISLANVSSSSVAWGDYDNDGDLDILLTGSKGYTPISKIYKNNGNNSFTEQKEISLINVSNGSTAWGDYDNDGYLDILLTGYTGSSCISQIYKNNGNNTFTEQTDISLIGVSGGSVAWGDYDNDGDLDILLTGNLDSSDTRISKIYKNNSNNTFTEQKGISLMGVDYSAVAWGDYDNDGDLDILLTGYSENYEPISKIYKNNGDNTFSEQKGISLTGIVEGSVAWGDYDNDGNLDILLTGHIGNGFISKIYRNYGHDTFTEQTGISLTGVRWSSVAWGDYDNDGDLDILLTGSTSPTGSAGIGITKIYKNNGNNNFTIQSDISLTGVCRGSVAWGDYDNDGDLDILLSGTSTSGEISKIYRNEGSIQNTPPTAPEISIPIVNKNSVTLIWGKATDGQTPAKGLTYNLYIKRLSNDSFVMSPMSDVTTGFRRIPKSGNINQVLTNTIQNLDGGEYKWYIQAIDNSFSGSIFSIGQNFKVAPLAPTQLAANATSLNEINLTWIDNSNNETGYVVERSNGNNQMFSPIDTLNSNSTNYTDIIPTPKTTYFYRVKAMYDNISSEYSNESNAITSLFTEQTGISLTGISYSSVAWGDYDSDGDLDIIMSGYTDSNAHISKIYKNNGNDSFTEQTDISLSGFGYNSVSWGDYDNDGDLDILYPENYNSKIYKNNGNNTFTEQTEISLPGVGYNSSAWGDYDNDGDLDILLTGSSGFGNISRIYKNNGNNTFTEQGEISLIGLADGSVAWADYDIDGDLDILLTGWVNNNFYISRIYKNNGNNTFTEQAEIKLTGVYSGSVAWGDYNNDGAPDILLTGYSGSSRISRIYKNNGNNTFTEQTGISLTGVSPASVAWGDYDNDGDLDILLTGSSDSGSISKIYKNNGNNTFTEQTNISLPAVSAGAVALGDYDNDGDLDILLTGSTKSGNISKIFKNEGSISNTLPAFPGELTQTINEKQVTLSWNDATDNETPGNGLSYNLFVQTTDGKFIKSPMADLGSGTRKVVGSGNVGQNNSYTINGLPQGSYTWSVQTIDHNYAGSKFAPSGKFEISKSNATEVMNRKGMVDVYPNPVVKNLTIVPVDNNKVNYEFIDLLGKLVKKGSISGKTVIETGSFLPGVYLLKIDNGKTFEFIKIIKEK